jgi:endonuclease YncB( thermonuclease family)
MNNQYQAITLIIAIIFIVILIAQLNKRQSPARNPKALAYHRRIKGKIDIYDGDTIYCNVDGYCVFGIKRVGVRFFGIDTPELTDKNPHIKMKAVAAKAMVKKAIERSSRAKLTVALDKVVSNLIKDI